MVGERRTDDNTARFEFVVQHPGIFHADPDPGAPASLIAAAEIDAGAITVHAGEVIAAPGSVLEAELPDIKMQAALHVFHAQDGRAVFEVIGGGWAGHGLGL